MVSLYEVNFLLHIIGCASNHSTMGCSSSKDKSHTTFNFFVFLFWLALALQMATLPTLVSWSLSWGSVSVLSSVSCGSAAMVPITSADELLDLGLTLLFPRLLPLDLADPFTWIHVLRGIVLVSTKSVELMNLFIERHNIYNEIGEPSAYVVNAWWARGANWLDVVRT